MPQPFPKGLGVSLQEKPRLLMDYPRHAAGVGLVISEWSSLEQQLFNVFTFALFASSPQGAGAQKVALAAWAAIESLRVKLNLIEELSASKLPKDLLEELKRKLIPSIQNRSKERHRIAHGHWGACKEFPDDIILIAGVGGYDEPMRYSVQDFEVIANRMIETSNEISTFWLRDAMPHIENT